MFFLKPEISAFSHIVSSYILRFVSSAQGTKFSQNSQNYTHLHQNENSKQTHTVFLRTDYCKKNSFLSGDTSL